MAFDNQEVATRARNIITERSPSARQLEELTVPKLQAMILNGLEIWTRATIKYPDRRQSFLTTVTTANAVAGVVDLTDHTDGTLNTIPIEEIDKVVIYDSTGKAMTKLQRRIHLDPVVFDGSTPSYFLDGFNLRILNTDGSKTSYVAAVSFTAPEYPVTVGAINTRLQGDFILFLAEWAMGNIPAKELQGA